MCWENVPRGVLCGPTVAQLGHEAGLVESAACWTLLEAPISVLPLPTEQWPAAGQCTSHTWQVAHHRSAQLTPATRTTVLVGHRPWCRQDDTVHCSCVQADQTVEGRRAGREGARPEGGGVLGGHGPAHRETSIAFGRKFLHGAVCSLKTGRGSGA